MSGALADVLARGFKSALHPVESTTAEPCAVEDLLALAGSVTSKLAEHRVAPCEPVHVIMANRAADLAALLGIWQAGAVAVPVHAGAAASTVRRIGALSKARLAVDRGRLEAIGSAAPPKRPLLHDAALVIFTSGSTGEPKGVVIGHRRFAEKLAVLDRLLGIDADDVVLCPLQLTFIFGLWVSLLTLGRGARLVLAPKFDRDAIGRALSEATIFAGVPSMLRALLSELPPNAPKLRAIFSGGEVLAPRLAGAARSHWSGDIFDLYGLTETGSCDFCLRPADQPQGLGTIGHPTDGVSFRLVRDGHPVVNSETGELQIRTPFGMHGYLDNPDLTAAAFADGYFKTGDLARRRIDGAVELVGRSTDMISRGGIKIAPLEIDTLIAGHPDVAAALCAGVPDERLGEVIHAVIVPRRGADLDAGALRAWLLARTERFKVPDVFYFRDTLPAGSTGKGDRKAIARLGGAGNDCA